MRSSCLGGLRGMRQFSLGTTGRDESSRPQNDAIALLESPRSESTLEPVVDLLPPTGHGAPLTGPFLAVGGLARLLPERRFQLVDLGQHPAYVLATVLGQHLAVDLQLPAGDGEV